MIDYNKIMNKEITRKTFIKTMGMTMISLLIFKSIPGFFKEDETQTIKNNDLNFEELKKVMRMK